MKLTMEMDELSDYGNTTTTLRDFYNKYKSEIIAQVATANPSINPTSFEGGIDSWWGLGSVMLFELDIQPTLTYTGYKVMLTIS